MKLRTLKPSIRTLEPKRMRAGGSPDKRASYSVRTTRRLKLWTVDPCCAACRKLTDFPWGFELDHKVPLHQGGPDTEDNSQVLCIECHRAKSAQEAAERSTRGGLLRGILSLPESTAPHLTRTTHTKT